jgi:hypothetical protein
MTDLYLRLGEVGFPRSYVKDQILPDWWEDELANDPGNRRLAEMAISRTLKIPLESLAEPDCPLSLEGAREVRFKRWQDSEESSLLPAVAVARRVFELLLSCAKGLPTYRLEGSDPDTLRERILAQSQYVTLATLLQYGWDFGVPIVHLLTLPTGAKRVDGMVFCVAGRPCIALASFKPSPAWLIWHLAHEMGHVARGHLRTGAALDIKIDFRSRRSDEKEANLFAMDLVYGKEKRKGFKERRHITGETLAARARGLGPAHGIYPGSIVASYGFHMKAWGTAQTALNTLGIAKGGRSIVRQALTERVDLDVLSETDRHFFVRATGIPE